MKITRTQKFSLAALWTVLVVLLLGSMPSGAGASSNGLLHSVITKDWTVTFGWPGLRSKRERQFRQL